MEKSNPQRSAIQDWLAAQNAQPLWHGTIPHLGAVDGYSINGALVVVLRTEHGHGRHGWDLLMPVCNTTSIADTLQAAEKLIKEQS
jgi:hypothetical protein